MTAAPFSGPGDEIEDMTRLFPRDGFESRLDDMRRAEYGSRWEIVTRYSVLTIVITILLLLIDRKIAVSWTACYVLLELGLVLTLTQPKLCPPHLRYGLALTFYLLSALCFMALPLYFIATRISPGLTFTGAAGLVGFGLYTLQRPQKEIGFVIADCLLVGILVLALVIVLQPMLDRWMDRVMVAFVALAVLGYYIGSMISGWRLQSDLRAAQKRYASAQMARALGQFVGGVAHDFNNQLTVILGNLELFDQLDRPDDRRRALEETRSAASRAAVTVKQLMASSGRTRLSPSAVPIEGFLYDLGEVLSDMLPQAMTVEITPPPDPLVARVDRDMLETCAIQLCLNAQEATSGRGTIRISADRRAMPADLSPPADAPPFIALDIEDDGPGVASEALPMLAEPFYSTKPAHEGRGLGLSSVAGFARQSGGGLHLDRPLRGGLRATLYLIEATSADQLSGST
ncbi:hypothetical protein KUW09_09120 [Mameliella alba]|nr:hypothetical protein [Antarctobacter heliothermus]MBY6144198.1 hypothetical protein [Mameliella alba]